MDRCGHARQACTSKPNRVPDYFFLHLLLPVWIGAYQFQGEVYHVVVNARTGDVEGERPYSAWKIGFLATVIIAIIIVALVVYNR